MAKYLMIGGGGHAKMIMNSILSEEYFMGYVDVTPKERMAFLKYIGDDDCGVETLRSSESIVPVLGIGLIKNYASRRNIIAKYEGYQVRFSPVIAESAVVADSVTVGYGSVVGVNALVNNHSRIGDYCIINSSAVVEHDVVLGSNVHIAPGAIVCGEVTISDNVFIGAGAVINNGIKICENVIIGSGSVVSNAIIDSGVYVGIPARRIHS